MSYLGYNVQKTSKNSNFRTAKKRENISRPRLYGEWDRKTFEYRRIGPDLPVTFFLIATSLTKNVIFVCNAGGKYIGQKKIVPLEKNFSPPSQQIKVFATNQKPNP